MHKSNKTLNYIVKKECAVNYWLRILNLVETDLNNFFIVIILIVGNVLKNSWWILEN